MKFLTSALLVLMLAGCASIKPVPFKGPNGNKAYSMHCSGMGRTLGKCYQKAGEVCPNGYSIVGQNTSTIAVPYNGSFVAAPQHSLTIECRQ